MLNAPSVTVLKMTLLSCLTGTYRLKVPLSNKNEIRKRKESGLILIAVLYSLRNKNNKRPTELLGQTHLWWDYI